MTIALLYVAALATCAPTPTAAAFSPGTTVADNKCAACAAVLGELQHALDREKPQQDVEISARLDSRGKRQGRVVAYRVSQVRAVELMGQICDQMPGYRAQKVPSAAALARAAEAKAAREATQNAVAMQAAADEAKRAKPKPRRPRPKTPPLAPNQKVYSAKYQRAISGRPNQKPAVEDAPAQDGAAAGGAAAGAAATAA